MKNMGWLLLFLMAVLVFAPMSGPAEGGESWRDNGTGYHSEREDVRRFLRYRRHRLEQVERTERRRRWEEETPAYTQTALCVNDFWGHCRPILRHRHAYRWRYLHRHRHRHAHRHGHGHRHEHREHWGSRERIDHGLQCHARRRVIGEERTSRPKAQRAADDAWMGSVRYDHGERYQDINHARDVRHNCDPSSTSSILKRVHYRCVLEATPCRAPTGATGERVQRTYEEEDDDRK